MDEFPEILKKIWAILEYNVTLGGSKINILGIIQLVVVIGVFFIFSKIFRRFLRKQILPRFNLATSAQFVILRIVHYTLVIIGFLVAINIVGIQLTSLTVIFGFLAVGLAFGLQNITSNFVSGVILLFERPIRVDDIIEIEDLLGRVETISIRSTKVITPDNVAMIVPNSKFIESTVTNWSVGDLKIRLNIPIGVAYGSDTQLVKKLLLEVADNHPDVLKDPKPDVFFREFADSSLNFELKAWIPSPTMRLKTVSDLNFAIDAIFRENNVTIPFPQRDVHIYNNK